MNILMLNGSESVDVSLVPSWHNCRYTPASPGLPHLTFRGLQFESRMSWYFFCFIFLFLHPDLWLYLKRFGAFLTKGRGLRRPIMSPLSIHLAWSHHINETYLSRTWSRQLINYIVNFSRGILLTRRPTWHWHELYQRCKSLCKSDTSAKMLFTETPSVISVLS